VWGLEAPRRWVMSWYVPVVIRIIVTYVALPVLVKPLAEHPARAPILALQFLGAVGLALPAALLLGQGTLHVPIAIVGFFTGLAAYAYWRAIDLSLSRTALFAFWDDLIAMGLSYSLLHEGQFLNAWMLIGIGVSVLAVILFTVHSYVTRSTGPEDQAPVPRVHFLYVGLYSVILGLGVFFMRYIGLQDVGLAQFLVNWYGGAWLAAGLLVLTFRARMRTPTVPLALSRQEWLRLGGGSFLILVAVGAAYGAYRLAPQTIVQPLFLVGEMVGPALVGLYVFGERDALARRDQLYFVLGLAGGLLVALSFSFP
jgi:hypothetical protein